MQRRALRLTRQYSSLTSSDILKRALGLVPQHGWQGSVIEVLRQCKMSDQAASLYTADDLVKFHYKQQLEKLRAYEPTGAPGFDRLKELVLFRLLEGNGSLGPQRLAEAIKLSVATSPLSTPWECLSEVSDELWYLAGDRSTDTTWYTRRGSLLGVYAACEAFQSRDHSRNFRDTKSVALSLLSKLETTEYAEQSVAEWLGFNVRAAYNVARTLR